MKSMKLTVAFILVAALAVGLLAGCGSAPGDLGLEPFALAWGIGQEEAEAALSCAYLTNSRSPEYVFVRNEDNDNALQAYGATPELIIYVFQAGGLGKVIYQFAPECYDQLLTYLDQTCGQRYFDQPMWGTADADVYLFETGILCIEYSQDPLADPKTVAADTRDRYQALAGAGYASAEKTASLTLQNYSLLWNYSTAQTDFVLTDHRK